MKINSKIIAQITGATLGTAVMATTVFGLERNNYYNTNAKYIVEEYATLDGSVEISDNNTKEYTLNNNRQKFTTGKKIYKELIDNNIKYIKINNRYYSIDGHRVNNEESLPYSELKNYDLVLSVSPDEPLTLNSKKELAFKADLKLTRKLF